jgi:hypothetical protein
MYSAIGAAVSGINNASAKFAVAANNIADPNASPAASGPGTSGDAATQLVQLNIASYDFRANVKVLELAEQAQKRLIDLIG